MHIKQLRICEICGKTSNETKVYRSIKFGMVLCNKHYNHMLRNGKILKRTRTDKNEIIKYDTYAEILLYDVKHNEIARTLIDLDDVAKCENIRWHIDNKFYVIGYLNHNHDQQIKLHRYLLQPAIGIIIDHKDHNSLNNRKENLRVCTQNQNIMNSSLQKNRSSKYKGVSFFKRDKKWRSQIMKNYKQMHIGYHNSEIDAAKAYNKKAIELYGEFAHLNIIEED